MLTHMVMELKSRYCLSPASQKCTPLARVTTIGFTLDCADQVKKTCSFVRGRISSSARSNMRFLYKYDVHAAVALLHIAGYFSSATAETSNYNPPHFWIS